MIYQLNFEQDLKRSIWHELGHLMVDLMIVEFDSEYFIEKFEINFQIIKQYIQNEKFEIKGWCGKVGIKSKTDDQFNPLINMDLLCLNIVSLSFGVILEAIYFTKNNTLVSPSYLLNDKKSGSSDLKCIHKLVTEICDLHLENNDVINNLRTNIEEIYKYLLNNEEFCVSMNKISESIVKDIFLSSPSDNAIYKYEMNRFQIISLSDEIIDLLSSDIRNKIICLKKQIEIDLMKSKNSNNIKSAQ